MKKILSLVHIGVLLVVPALAQDAPDLGFPSTESQAHSMATALLAARQHRAVHQICAVYSPTQKSVLIEEIWLDLPTKESRKTVRVTPSTEKNPLADLAPYLQKKPDHGVWRTVNGVMGYRGERDSYIPVISRVDAALAPVYKRLLKEWFLWEGAPIAGNCCGGATVIRDEEASRIREEQYRARLARVNAGTDPASIREQDGLVTEIRVGKGDTLLLYVKNEFLKDSPVSLSLEQGEALRRKSNVAIFPYPRPLNPVPHGNEGYGLAIGVGKDGAYVLAMNEKSPAVAAGVAVGDRFISINGQPLDQRSLNVADALNQTKTATVLFARPTGATYSVTLTKIPFSTK